MINRNIEVRRAHIPAGIVTILFFETAGFLTCPGKSRLLTNTTGNGLLRHPFSWDLQQRVLSRIHTVFPFYFGCKVITSNLIMQVKKSNIFYQNFAVSFLLSEKLILSLVFCYLLSTGGSDSIMLRAIFIPLKL